MENFANILEDISLSNIIKTINLIEDRFQTIHILEQYVFNKELKANEVNDLQNLISQHYRIF
jgi:hypothetical protein